MSPRKSRLAIGLGRALVRVWHSPRRCRWPWPSRRPTRRAGHAPRSWTRSPSPRRAASRSCRTCRSRCRCVTSSCSRTSPPKTSATSTASCPACRSTACSRRSPASSCAASSTDDFGIGTDPAVGVYVDGVYAGRGGGVLLPFTDLRAHRSAEGSAGHAVRPQHRGRCDLDHHHAARTTRTARAPSCAWATTARPTSRAWPTSPSATPRRSASTASSTTATAGSRTR